MKRVAGLLCLVWLLLVVPALAQSPSPSPPEIPVASFTPSPSVVPQAASPSSIPEVTPRTTISPSPVATPSADASSSPAVLPFPRTRLPFPALSPRFILPSATPTPLSHDRAAVTVDRIVLLRVGGGGDLTPQERCRLLQERLETVVARAVDAPNVTVTLVGANPVIQAEGVHIMTVTEADALREAEPLAIVAVMWRDDLERGLRKIWRERSGSYLGRAVTVAFLSVLLGLGLHFLAGGLSRRFLRDPGWLLQSFVWLCVVTVCLWQFPDTRGVGQFVHDRVLGPLFSVIGVVGAGLVAWAVAKAVLNRYREALVAIRSRVSVADVRGVQRVETVYRALQVVVGVILGIMVLSGVMLVLHLNPATLLASAGFLGVAVGLAAQDQVKDWTAGLSIIFEDQFGVGDSIQVGAQSGTVVAFTLRATQIRNSEGSLVTIPNGAMRIVENQSNQWSQVDLRISIDYATPDPERALGLLEQAARELRAAEPHLVIDDPEVLGIDEITEKAIVLRMLLKTAPQKQFQVRRMLLERVKKLLDGEGIRLPATRVWIREAPLPAAPVAASEPSTN